MDNERHFHYNVCYDVAVMLTAAPPSTQAASLPPAPHSCPGAPLGLQGVKLCGRYNKMGGKQLCLLIHLKKNKTKNYWNVPKKQCALSPKCFKVW